ncbi:MAG: hypothetical protein JW940_01425 [Polyangiaceae bacterium]|nr:hypothetical protein [Polyangiaceae bacterium]
MSLGAPRWRVAALVLALEAPGCHRSEPGGDSTPIVAASSTPGPRAATLDARAAVPADPDLLEFRRLFALSEPGESFISDNVVSNETSLLQPAQQLTAVRGGAYIGVGPEQNYTYIALSRPALAILLDLRRDNALLHLLYKVLFDGATSRLELLCLLLGRPYDSTLEPEPKAHADTVLAALETVARDRTWFDRQHGLLQQRLQSYGLGLSSADIERIDHIHELFFLRQLEIRFELHKSSGRMYPSLRSLLVLRTPSGQGTFLDSEDSFRFVQTLHRRHRIVPCVGDVSEPRPLRTIAEALRRRALPLRTFYISNVEQYLIGQPSFAGWLDNLRQLPQDEQSILLRCYLDQGQPHPRQQPGRRTTTFAHRLGAFLRSTKKRPPRSYFDLATQDALLVRSGTVSSH